MTDEPQTAASTRRRFLRTGAVVASGLALGASATGTATAQAPNFAAGIWGDGDRWGTKGLRQFPEPNNKGSLDKLFMIDGQAPLAEAAPGNPAYNGGRWWVHTVTVENDGDIDFPITSYAELASHVDDVTITPVESASAFFECPLLPYKG